MDIIKNINELRQISRKYDFEKDTNIKDIVLKLNEVLKFSRGIGISAIQIGIPIRVFVIGMKEENLVFINPNIVHFSDKKIKLEEGCLSFPNKIIPVKRPEIIRVRYQNINGEIFTNKFVGITSRIIQHEVDHLNGKLFLIMLENIIEIKF